MPAAEAEPDGADEPSPEELAAAALQLKTFVDECHQALENQKLLAAHRKHAPRDNRVRNTDVVRLVAGGLLHDARVKGGLFSIKEAADAGVELLLATATCSTSTHPFSEDDRAHSFAVAQSAIRLHGRDAIILRRSLTIMATLLEESQRRADIAGGAAPDILVALENHKGDREVLKARHQQAALEVLQHMIQPNELQDTDFAGGVIDLFSEIVRQGGAGAPGSQLRRRACELLGVAVATAKGAETSKLVNAALALTEALRQHYTDGNIAEAALYAVRGLLQNRDCRVAAFRTGLIDAILAAQQASPSDPEVQLRACNALGTMSADPEAGARALQKGAMESVVFYSIQPHTDVLEIVQAASIAIHWMFSAAPEDARVRAKGLSLLPQLAILLTRYYKKASFAVPCLRIMSEVMDTDNALWEAVECGLGKLAPQVAEAHRQDAAVHVSVCRIVELLARGQRPQLWAAAARGLPAVFHTVDFFTADADAVMAASLALQAVSSGRSLDLIKALVAAMREDPLLPKLVEAVHTHLNSPQVVVSVMRVFKGALVANHQGDCPANTQRGGVEGACVSFLWALAARGPQDGYLDPLVLQQANTAAKEVLSVLAETMTPDMPPSPLLRVLRAGFQFESSEGQRAAAASMSLATAMAGGGLARALSGDSAAGRPMSVALPTALSGEPRRSLQLPSLASGGKRLGTAASGPRSLARLGSQGAGGISSPGASGSGAGVWSKWLTPSPSASAGSGGVVPTPPSGPLPSVMSGGRRASFERGQSFERQLSTPRAPGPVPSSSHAFDAGRRRSFDRQLSTPRAQEESPTSHGARVDVSAVPVNASVSDDSVAAILARGRERRLSMPVLPTQQQGPFAAWPAVNLSGGGGPSIGGGGSAVHLPQIDTALEAARRQRRNSSDTPASQQPGRRSHLYNPSLVLAAARQALSPTRHGGHQLPPGGGGAPPGSDWALGNANATAAEANTSPKDIGRFWPLKMRAKGST